MAGRNRFQGIWIFDFSTNKWTLKATHSKNQQYPDDRFYESLAFSGNLGFMSGGIIPYTANTLNSDIWRIGLESLEWLKLEYSLDTCVFDHRMSVVNDHYLFTFGGYHNQDSVNTFECFTVQPQTLYRLCLGSISHSQNLRNYIKSLPVSMVDECNLNENDTFFDS
ncbi:hypothetical protein RF11_10736 [Thelohanellus kitauei]|uniref:Kelch domain-containing protein 10 n=1 Tax=Thelohanellus kitauei TaxID=669202 RepID=A0A0C2JSB6_THEKT|nr:hypothetical protein RF11_10736 [Thelohanellus kitauei]